jgi:hypothetical protein
MSALGQQRTWIGANLCVFGRRLSVPRIVVPKRRFEIRPDLMPTIETARKDGALRTAIASTGRDGERPAFFR